MVEKIRVFFSLLFHTHIYTHSFTTTFFSKHCSPLVLESHSYKISYLPIRRSHNCRILRSYTNHTVLVVCASCVGFSGFSSICVYPVAFSSHAAFDILYGGCYTTPVHLGGVDTCSDFLVFIHPNISNCISVDKYVFNQ